MADRRTISKVRLAVYTPGLWIMALYRLGNRLCRAADKNRLLKLVSIPYGFLYFLLGVVTGIYIPLETDIGPGLYIGHWGGIMVHPKTVIGENCNLSQGVTIGEGGRAGNRGVPRIGDRVYIAPGAKVFGDIVIGNDVAIGANAVVNKSVPDKAVVGGIPAAVISMDGSADFVILSDD
ncbi:MAG: serine acetyltransferase [Candidatus Hydrogenedentes bacterium]|nr:serine acetyltransferase [Candidatus Hydrogenedentota bacterium]